MAAVPGEAVSVADYYKQNVYDTSDNTIGDVSDVLLDKDGRVTAVILSVGGFLGVQSRGVMDWVEPEATWVFCPDLADVFVRGEAT